jgi:hypothetical protein
LSPAGIEREREKLESAESDRERERERQGEREAPCFPWPSHIQSGTWPRSGSRLYRSFQDICGTNTLRGERTREESARENGREKREEGEERRGRREKRDER